MFATSLVVSGAIGAAVFAGTPGGTGENYCHLTWDKQCCPVPGCNVSIAPGVLTICNEKPDPAEFHWELIDTSGMGLQFMPQSGIAAPGNSPFGIPTTCIDIPFTVICPPNFPVGSVADYQAIVTKVGTGETFTCFGNVVNHSEWKLDTPGDPVIDVAVPAPGETAEPTRGQLVVSNIGSSGKDGVSIYPEPMGPFNVAQSRIDIPPIPPGTSFSVDSFFDVTYQVSPQLLSDRGGPLQDTMGDILFKIDTTGDGVGDTVIGSVTVRGVPGAAPCVGDLNGDGIVDTADLGILLGRFGFPCP
jgi:hypothetical protein